LLQSSSSSSLPFVQKLTASNGDARHYFGEFNQLAISNNRIIIGAKGYDFDRGATYVFGDPNDLEAGQSYSQLATLTASDGGNSNWFGESVAMDGDIIVVGASGNGIGGAAYVYRIVDDSSVIAISQVTKLTASNGMTGDGFGTSVFIHGNLILVGAPGVKKNGSEFVGSAYLFGNPSTDPDSFEWTQLQQFQPRNLTGWDWFGYSLAMDKNIVVIGTSGDANAVYVYSPVNNDDVSSSLSTSWIQTAKLIGATGQVGHSVAVSGNWIVAGAPSDDNSNGSDAGAVLVFTKMSSSQKWTQVTRLLAADGASSDLFGSSVSISKDATTLVVGATRVDFNTSIVDSGAAYMFRITNSTTTMGVAEWTQVGKFMAADRDSSDELGFSIAIENNIVVVGASGDDSFKGSAYILDTESTWMTTDPPTAEPTKIATPQPTFRITAKPTSLLPTTLAPTLVNGDSDNSSSPQAMTIPISSARPVTTPTTPPKSSTTTNDPTTNDIPTKQPSPLVQPTSDSESPFTPGVIVGMSATAGVVAALIVFLNYRLLQRERREQQQQQLQQPQDINARNDPSPLPPFAAAAVQNETIILTDSVVKWPRSSGTMVVDAILDPNPDDNNAAPITAVDCIANLTCEELPRYKDQVRPVEPRGQSNNLPSSS
jgi:hypothetical protein